MPVTVRMPICDFVISGRTGTRAALHLLRATASPAGHGASVFAARSRRKIRFS